MRPLDEKHPKQVLLFYSTPTLTEDQARKLELGMQSLAIQREWTIDEPVCIDDQESEFPTTGVMLSLYSAHPPWGARLPRMMDRAQFEEVKAVVELLKEYTLR